jgi:hypothetical protein
MDVKAFRDYYEFDDDDLYANRMGRLSDKQYQAIARVDQATRHFGRVGGVAAMALSAIVPCVALPASLLTIYTKDWSTTLIAWAGSLVWLAIFGGAGAWLLLSSRSAGQPSSAVSQSEGPAELRQEKRTTGGKYPRSYLVQFLKVGDLDFELDDDLVGRVAEGENLAVYFTGGRILSVEPLPAR